MKRINGNKLLITKIKPTFLSSIKKTLNNDALIELYFKVESSAGAGTITVKYQEGATPTIDSVLISSHLLNLNCTSDIVR